MLSNGRTNDDRKIIVRQLDFNTTQTTIEQYFSQFGHVREIIMKFNENGRSKGFCFVIFSDKSTMESVVKQAEHIIDDRSVQVRAAVDAPGGNHATRKIFCGGLPHGLSEAELSAYFSQYGEIESFEFVYEKETQVRKHFCFIVFVGTDAPEKITEGKLPPGSVIHHIGKYRVECKKKFEDNHPLQKKVKYHSNQKKVEARQEMWEHEAPPPPPVRAPPVRAPPRRPGYAPYPAYESYTDPYAAEADPYYSGGYSAGGYSAPTSYPPPRPSYHAPSYSSYPAYQDPYETEYTPAPKAGGPIKQRGGGRGGAYRPY